MVKKSKDSERPLVTNRQARRDYMIEDSFEAGMSLLGTEVKSIRAGKASLQDSFVDLRGEEAFLVGAHVAEYGHASMVFNHAPRRTRKLLLNKREILKLTQRVLQKGYTLVPLAIVVRGRWLKIVVGLGKGKKRYDKRDDIKARDVKRDMDRAVRRGRE